MAKITNVDVYPGNMLSLQADQVTVSGYGVGKAFLVFSELDSQKIYDALHDAGFRSSKSVTGVDPASGKDKTVVCTHGREDISTCRVCDWKEQHGTGEKCLRHRDEPKDTNPASGVTIRCHYCGKSWVSYGETIPTNPAVKDEPKCVGCLPPVPVEGGGKIKLNHIRYKDGDIVLTPWGAVYVPDPVEVVKEVRCHVDDLPPQSTNPASQPDSGLAPGESWTKVRVLGPTPGEVNNNWWRSSIEAVPEGAEVYDVNHNVDAHLHGTITIRYREPKVTK